MTTNNQDTTPRGLRTLRMRRKVNFTAADPTRFSYTDGNSFDVTIGGTASDGDYVVTINPLVDANVVVPAADASITGPSVTVTRATTPAANTNIATQMATNATTAIAAGRVGDRTSIANYIESVSSSGAVTSWIVRRGAPPFYVTVSETTATGTLAVSPDDVFPITFDTIGLVPQGGPRTSLEFAFIPVNSSGVPVDPQSITVDVTIRRMIDRATYSSGIPRSPVGVTSAATTTSHPIAEPYRILAGGGRYACGLSATSGTPSGASALEVWVREVTE